jgi:hypothetical protein
MSNPNALMTAEVGGRKFKCTRRTYAHLVWTIERLEHLHPKAYLRIIQTSYNTGVAASAGTHDFDAAFDVEIVGLDWWSAQRFLRAHGWAAWVRLPPAFGWHIHMISIPKGGRSFPQKVGIYVPGQLVDYYNHTFGLKNQHNVDLDKSWFPGDEGPNPPVGTPAQWRRDIDATIFDFEEWERELEDEMKAEDWDRLRKIVREEVDGALDTPVKTKEGNRSLRQMVKEVFNAVKGAKP